jgi:hypothetical protein
MPPRYITLVSNGCLGEFPENTLSSFTNRFTAIKPRKGSPKLYVRLRSIMISRKLTYDHPDNYLMNIRLAQVVPQPSINFYDQSLGYGVFPPQSQCGVYGIKEFEHAPFLPLQWVPVTRLSVLILNARGKALPLAPGPPTFVVLEIATSMDEMDIKGSFTVTAVSNISRELQFYPDNNPNEFKTKLPNAMHLIDYEVALVSVAFPKDMYLDTQELWWQLTYDKHDGEEPVSSVWPFDVDNYTSSLELYEDMKQSLEDDPVFSEFLSMNRSLGGPDTLNYGRFEIVNNAPVNTRVEFSCSPSMANILGLINVPYTNVLMRNRTSMLFPQLDLDAGKISSIGMLYADCINPQIVGNGLYQLLHVIPLDLNRMVYEPEHLTFHTVVERPFSAIAFEIRQPNGRPHNIKTNSGSSLAITLLFRPVKSQRWVREYREELPPEQRLVGGGRREGGDGCSKLSVGMCDISLD